MAENSAIEWTHHTFNPWVGCTKVSAACDHCYAEGWAKRAGNPELWQGERRKTSEANWREPAKWNRKAGEAGIRYRVFCASLADVFDNQVPEGWRQQLFGVIATTPHLDWLLLTKRPQNIAKMVDVLPRNVWLGTTAENMAEMDRRWSHLARVPAAVRFVSYEPALGPLEVGCFDVLPDWIIAGGESGGGYRKPDPEWFRAIRDECAALGIPFFMKQMGGLRKPFPVIPDDLMLREYPDA
jgi:protein gp37